MDLSKLDQAEKMAVYGSIAVVLAGLVSAGGGLLFLAILAAIGMVVVVFLPQFSPGTSLPGSKGSLMAALGFVAAGAALITLLQWIGYISLFFSSFTVIMLIVAVVGALVMAWAGWQALQAEGGRWQFGTSTTAATSASTEGDQPRHTTRETDRVDATPDEPAERPPTDEEPRPQP